MKQLTLFTIILFSTLSGYSQQTASYDKEQYDQLRSSAKHAMVGVIVCSAAGGGLIIGGLFTALVGAADEQTDAYGEPISGTQNQSLINTGLIIAGAGVITELISIPFYVKSSHDRAAARELRFHAHSSSYTVPVSGFKSLNRPQLGIGLSISL